MSQIIYKNEYAIIRFQYPDVIEALSTSLKEHDLEDDSMLLKWLQDNSGNGQQNISINSERDLENDAYVGRIVYVIKDLLLKGEGSVHCKKCGRHIPGSKIKIDQTTPFDAHKGLDKKTVEKIKKEHGLKGRIRFPASGGTTFFCDRGHELFGTMDWIT